MLYSWDRLNKIGPIKNNRLSVQIEFFLAKAFHDSAFNLTVKALKRRAVPAFAAAGNCAQRRIQGVLKSLHRAIYQ